MMATDHDPQIVQKAFAFCALLVAACLGAHVGRIAWFHAFINERMFSEPFAWFNSPQALSWSFELLFFFVFGVVVGWIFRTSKPRLWGFALGAICGALHFFGAVDLLQPEAPISIYFWVYGVYAVPSLGALLGATTSQWISGHSMGPTVAAARQFPGSS